MNGDKDRLSRNIDFLVIDTLSLVTSFVISYRIKFGDFGFADGEYWLPLLFIIILVNAVICLFSNPYKNIIARPYYEEILRSLILTVYNLVTISVIFYIFKVGILFSRQTVLIMYIICFLLSLILKCLWKRLIRSKKIRSLHQKKLNLLIISDKNDCDEIIRAALAGDTDEYEVRVVFSAREIINKVPGIRIAGTADDISSIVNEENISDILIDSDKNTLSAETYEELIRNGVAIHFSIGGLIGFESEYYSLGRIGMHNSLCVGKYTFTQGQVIYLGVKRILDIILGFIGIICLIPVTAVIKIIYLISGDRAKIFYKQKRIGRNGKPINIYKFRTMIPDADKKLEELLKDEKLKAEWAANQKLSDDPRITKTGKFLRKSSIDELPQIINVFLGEMSIVGPRPLVECELEKHGGMKLYQQVKPGITGWWGCNGRSNINYAERLELEYYYVRNFSVYLDFLCVLRTVLSVLTGRGAG